MSFSTLPLTEFLTTVPTCDLAVTGESLWSVFRHSDANQIVITSRHGRPLGIVSLYRLIRYLPAGSPLSGDIEASLIWQQPILDCYPPLLDPLLIIPASLSLEEFWQSLSSQHPIPRRGPPVPVGFQPKAATLGQVWPAVPIAIVSEPVQFMGLLDSLSFLKFLASSNLLQWGGGSSGSCTSGSPLNWDRTSVAGYSPLLLPADTPPDQAGVVASLCQTLMPLLEKLPIPLSVYGENGEVLSQNLAWRSLIGSAPLPVQEAAETIKNLSGLPPTGPEEEEAEPSHRSYCHLGAQPNTYICVCPISPGQERVWQFVKQPLESQWGGRDCFTSPAPAPPCLWLVLAQDVTEQHLVAQELAAKNADLVQLNRLKDEFLACISHELKTPLTAVLGLSSLLKDQSLGQLNERQVRYAQLIHQSGRHLMTVVNDILDLTRMETGQLELSAEPMQIKSLCERAFEEAKRVYYHRESTHPSPTPPPEFTLQIEPGLESLIGDELRVRQMLVHLLVNALKFTTFEDKIGLSVNRWEGWITFTVWDTGIGIPDDKQHLIFQKFQQLENPLTRQFEGAGLGLVLTQKLARLHGGDITFLSKAGIGSEFTLLLPPSLPPKSWQRDSADPSKHPRNSRVSKHSRLVLIVEAVPRFIEDLTAQLTGLGYRVVIARSGPEALEKARRLQPRVIFLNPLLPLLSGWDVLTLLKTNPETDQLPVVVMTTRSEKQRADVNRANGFLSVPVQQSALAECLAHLIDPAEVTSVAQDSITLLRLSPLKFKNLPEMAHRDLAFLEDFFNLRDTELEPNPLTPHLNQVFTDPRVLEADDLAQAELLARVWKPDVIILENTQYLGNLEEFFQELMEHKTLITLPMITLDLPTTQAANLLENLSIFPCLIFDSTSDFDAQSIRSVLLQVIQVAVGLKEEPQILVVDLTTLSDIHLEMKRNKVDVLLPQALVHYIETAGFRGGIGRSWSEVLQQLKYQTVDLLLMYLQYPMSPELISVLSRLSELEIKPKIVILDHSDAHQQLNPGSHLERQQLITNLKKVSTSEQGRGETSLSPQEVMTKILGINVQVLPSSLSMTEVLEEIKKCLRCHS